MNLKNPKNTFWNKKKVIVTGHTGFKGSWLSYWLLQMGANIYGISLEPNTSPNLFDELKLKQKIYHHVSDITNQKLLEKLISDIQPDIIFHMAARNGTKWFYEEPFSVLQNCTTPTLNLIERYKDTKVKFIYASSCEIYADSTESGINKVPTSEDVSVLFSNPKNLRWSKN